MKYKVIGTVEAENEEDLRELFLPNRVSISIERHIYAIHISDGSFQWQINFAVNDSEPNLSKIRMKLNHLGFINVNSDFKNLRVSKGNIRLSVTSEVEGPIDDVDKDIETMIDRIEKFIDQFLTTNSNRKLQKS